MWRIFKGSSPIKCSRYHCQQNIRSSNASPSIKNDEHQHNKNLILERLHADLLKKGGTQSNKDDHRKWRSFKHCYSTQDSDFYSHCVGWVTGAAIGFQFCKHLMTGSNFFNDNNSKLKYFLPILSALPHKTLKQGVLSGKQPSTSISSSSSSDHNDSNKCFAGIHKDVFEEDTSKISKIAPNKSLDPLDKLATDAKSVFSNFEKVASECSAKTHTILGLAYMHQGQLEKAVSHFQQGSLFGSIKAQYNLAICYDHGKGILRNQEKAIEYYKLASEGGHPLAAYNLALFHLSGMGTSVSCSMKEALRLLQLAADKGLDCAESLLGIVYTQPGQKDFDKAIIYLQKAAKKKNILSQFYLGICYQNGWGVEKDWTLAVHYYREATDNGHKEAQAIFESNSKGIIEIEKSEISLLYNRMEEKQSCKSDIELDLRTDNDSHLLLESLSSSILLNHVSLLSLYPPSNNSHSENRSLKNSASATELGQLPPIYWSLQQNVRTNRFSSYLNLR